MYVVKQGYMKKPRRKSQNMIRMASLSLGGNAKRKNNSIRRRHRLGEKNPWGEVTSPLNAGEQDKNKKLPTREPQPKKEKTHSEAKGPVLSGGKKETKKRGPFKR